MVNLNHPIISYVVAQNLVIMEIIMVIALEELAVEVPVAPERLTEMVCLLCISWILFTISVSLAACGSGRLPEYVTQGQMGTWQSCPGQTPKG